MGDNHIDVHSTTMEYYSCYYCHKNIIQQGHLSIIVPKYGILLNGQLSCLGKISVLGNLNKTTPSLLSPLQRDRNSPRPLSSASSSCSSFTLCMQMFRFLISSRAKSRDKALQTTIQCSRHSHTTWYCSMSRTEIDYDNSIYKIQQYIYQILQNEY